MNKANDKPYSSTPPHQRLSILCSEMLTPIQIIQGCIAIIKKHQVLNNETPEDLLECIVAIENAASRLTKLRDDLM